MNRYQKKQLKAYSVLGAGSVLLIILLVIIGFGKHGSNRINATGSLSPELTEAVSLSPSPSPTLAVSQQKAKLQFMGDVVLHNTVLKSAKTADGTYNFTEYFSAIKPYLNGDAVFANLEGVVSSSSSGYSGSPLFNYPASIAFALKESGITSVITANDHAYDKLMDGIVSTNKVLKEAGLDAIGTYTSQAEYNTPFIKDINGIKVGIVAYSDSTNNMQENMPPEQLAYTMRMIDWNDIKKTTDNIANDITDIRQAGAEIVILSFHWGNNFENNPSNAQRELAQASLETGADIIMGTRSHVAQPVTVKNIKVNGTEKKVVILYSLGNFFADQFADNNAKTQAGFICNINIARNEQTLKAEIGEVSYLPTYINRWVLSDSTNTQDSIYNYRVLPSAIYATAQTRPTAFASDAEWNLCKNAYNYIKSRLEQIIMQTGNEEEYTGAASDSAA